MATTKERDRADAEIEASPAMIAAGVAIYDAWEPEHIFDDALGGAGDEAKRELVARLYAAMRRLER
jgi:hypothetical protein